MGIGNRLHGKLPPYQGDDEIICPRCGRDVDEFELVIEGGIAVKQCPFCHQQIEDDQDEET
jgi:hypothetical protein